jgi:hypothetical protein
VLPFTKWLISNLQAQMVSLCVFFQDNWEEVGMEVCVVALDFFNNGVLDESVNTTHIALKPKMINPSKVIDFRPISLCNVFYKILSKVLANRLKVILPRIISKNQSAFVPGHLISDNILVAYEILHTMHARMWRRWVIWPWNST